MQTPRGFTLIELMVVFAIMALVVAIVPPALGKLYDAAQYRETLRSIMSDMQQARFRAMTHGKEVRFQVDLRNRTYGIEGGAVTGLADSLQVRATVADIEMHDDIAAILFLPQGGATGGSIDVIRADTGAGTRLRVDWLSGRVEQEPVLP